MPATHEPLTRLPTRLLVMLVLAVLAVAGNLLSVPLLFGVDLIFGSVAVLLAVVLLGPWPATLVAAVGGLYTLVLWGHPYALVIFILEALVVGLLYRRGVRPLVVADLAYWLVLGVPLVVLLYRGALGMDSEAATLIAFKQPLNGVFNALLAGLVLIAMRAVGGGRARWVPGRLRLIDLLFHAVLGLTLLAGAVPIVHEGFAQRGQQEQLTAQLLEAQQEQVIAELRALPVPTAAAVEQALVGRGDPSTQLAVLDEQGQVLASRGRPASVVEGTGSSEQIGHGLSIWLPAGDLAAMERWKRGRYLLTTTVEDLPGIGSVVLETPAAPVVRSLETQRTTLFALLSGVLLVAVLASAALSRSISRPLHRLQTASADLTTRIAQGACPGLPSSQIEEYDHLGVTLGQMSAQLADSFHELHEIRAGLAAQVEQRTQQLASSLEQYTSLVDNIPGVTYRCRNDADWTMLHLSRHVDTNTGYAAEELLDNRVTSYGQLIDPGDRPAVVEAVEAAIAERRPWQVEYRVRHRDGSIRRVSERGRAVFDEDGEVRHLDGFILDVTERTRLAEQLQREQQRLRSILDGTNVGTWEWNVQSGATVFNERWAEIVGYELAELEPVSIETWASFVHPEDLALSNALLEEHFAGRSAFYDCEARMRHRDGHWVWVHDRGRVASWTADGQPLWMAGTHQDIAERKRVEQELIEAKMGAEAASVAKSRFLATMSHEIRTPMNGILGMAQLLLAGPVDERRLQDYAHTILQSGRSLLALLNDVLDLSRIEAGGLRLEQGVVAPARLLAEVDDLYGGRARGRGLGFCVRWDGAADERFVGDPHRLRQMLSNLVDNAVKFTEQGEVGVEAGVAHESEGQAMVAFTVWDTGIGLSDEQAEQLFVPFRQLDDSSTRRFEGTGLGLSIVRSLAQAMGGGVEVAGELGEGARFRFEVPMKRVDGEHGAGTVQAAGDGGGTDPAPISGRVLLVEDREDNRIIVGAMLELLGMHPVVATDGEQAVAQVCAERFDAVVMDVHMPVLDGVEATEQIRSWERAEGGDRVPIIALSASAFPEDRARCFEAGMDAFLAKPVELAALASVAAAAVEGQDAGVVDGSGLEQVDWASVMPDIEELVGLLRAGRFDAVQRYEGFEAAVAGTVLAPELRQLRSEVEEFRFDTAADHLTRLAAGRR